MMADNADDIQASLCSAEDELKQQIRVAGPGPGAATSTASTHLHTDNCQSQWGRGVSNMTQHNLT